MQLEVTYNLTELRDLAKRFPEAARAEEEAVLWLIVQRLEKDVAEKTPAGVGGQAGLRGSIVGEVVHVGGQQLMGVVSPTGVAVKYGDVIEEGRRPGQRMPPPAALVSWVKEKLEIKEGQTPEGVAFVVARSIGKEGLEGVHMFQKAWDKNERWVQDQINSIPGRVVKRVQNGVG